MAIYEYTPDAIRLLDETTFASERIAERADLQRLLRRDIEVVGPDLFVLTDEFSDWEDSRRRIDILAVDRDANLVVVELKRDDSGEHMDLQAVRYAAMVSAMNWEQAVDTHRAFRQREGLDGDASEALMAFLGWKAPQRDFAQDVRIVLVSADFSRELTTAVIWLWDHGIDIRCVRLKPFKSGGRVFLEAQQVLPLPEATDYQVRLREKAEKEREAKGEQNVHRRFWAALLPKARARCALFANVNPSAEQWVTGSHRGVQFNFVTRQNDGRVEVYFASGTQEENRARYDALWAQRAEIEAAFGGPLEWMPLEGAKACRICKTIDAGGYRSPEEDWGPIQDAYVDAMARLEQAIRPRVS